eukprot:13487-Heterococcus_DN1.PRE.3
MTALYCDAAAHISSAYSIQLVPSSNSDCVVIHIRRYRRDCLSSNSKATSRTVQSLAACACYEHKT